MVVDEEVSLGIVSASCSTRGIIVVDGGFVAEVLYRYKWLGKIVVRIYKSEEYVLGCSRSFPYTLNQRI